jgi:Tfp pilus assembly protein PilF
MQPNHSRSPTNIQKDPKEKTEINTNKFPTIKSVNNSQEIKSEEKDTNTYIEAKYELAHLYMKRKKYEKARTALDEILDIYNNAPSGSLPAAYKKLAQIEMAKIPD